MQSANPSNEQVEQWKADAEIFLDTQRDKALLIEHLLENDCPVHVANDIYRDASKTVRMRHRVKGLRAVGIGVALIAVGGVSVYFADQAISNTGGSPAATIGGAFGVSAFSLMIAPVLPVIGVVYVIGGLYKLFTGSTVDVED